MRNNLLLLISIIILYASSCIKEPKFEDDINTPASIDEIQNTLIDAWGNGDPMSMNKNEVTYIETTQQVETTEPKYLEGHRLTVLEKINCSLPENTELNTCIGNTNKVFFHIKQEKHEVGQTVPTTTERFEPFILSQATLQSHQKNELEAKGTNYPLSIDILLGLLSLCESAPGIDIKCENLSEVEFTEPAPELIRSQENCAGLQNCELHYKKVKFDIVFTSKNSTTNTESTQRVKYEVKIAQQAPFLSRIMEYCYKGLVDVPAAGQKVLVKICNSVKNFRYPDSL